MPPFVEINGAVFTVVGSEPELPNPALDPARPTRDNCRNHQDSSN
jgi:hypothetical protein